MDEYGVAGADWMHLMHQHGSGEAFQQDRSGKAVIHGIRHTQNQSLGNDALAGIGAVIGSEVGRALPNPDIAYTRPNGGDPPHTLQPRNARQF